MTACRRAIKSRRVEYFPVLERAFDYSTSKAALVLLAAARPRSVPRDG
jgi:hypothetical protein